MFRRTGLSSILLVGMGLLLMGSAARLEASEPGSDYDRTIQALVACGVPAAHVRITYEDLLQSDLVRIDDLGGGDEVRFRCLRKAVHPAYIVDVSAAPQRAAYQAFADSEDDKDARAEARNWLRTAGLLDRVPRYDPRKGLNAFARALEGACGIRAGGALETFGSSGLTIRRSFFGDFKTTSNYDELGCLLRMESASNAEEHNIILTFIGNAAADEGDR